MPLAAAAANVADAAATPSAWATILTRLAVANSRSAAMTSLQYAMYGRGREAGFTSPPAIRAAFARLLPPPALPDGALEVLAFVVYDRVMAVAEAANRLAHPHAAPALVHTMTSLPRAAYDEALREQLPLPLELHRVFVAAAARARELAAGGGAAAAAPPPPPPAKRQKKAAR